jgi:hypothetical protein
MDGLKVSGGIKEGVVVEIWEVQVEVKRKHSVVHWKHVDMIRSETQSWVEMKLMGGENFKGHENVQKREKCAPFVWMTAKKWNSEGHLQQA